MDVQMASPTFASSASGRPAVGTPPVLGAPVPGTTGGLPAQGGLSVLAQPMAQQLQSMGRGEDSMLVHMTPNEVNSLQGLAMAHGGSLSINPQTGLPEAGWLGDLLPSIIGFGLNFIPGVGPLLAAGLTAAGTTAVTGDLSKGLMAGLQAFGGASLAGAVAPGATGAATAAAQAGTQAATQAGTQAATQAATQAGTQAATQAATQAGTQAATQAGTQAASAVASKAPVDLLAQLPKGVGGGIGGTISTSMTPAGGLSTIVPGATEAGTQAAKTGLAGFMQRFGDTAKAALPQGTPGIVKSAAPMLAGMGLTSGLTGGLQTGSSKNADGAIDNSYQGPYTAQKRKVIATPTQSELENTSGERRWFDVAQPEVYNAQGQVVVPGSNTAPGTPIVRSVLNPKAKKGQPMYSFVTYPWAVNEMDNQMGYAKGGEVSMDDGAFVLDARTVSEIGNGSSNAGKEILRRIGGLAIEGPGDGVSDSVPARIGRDQPARVARDEVVVPARAVQRLGKGNAKRGADKLYALMDKAHKARKKAKRGQDTGLRRGLA